MEVPNISYAMGVVSQFMHNLHINNWNVKILHSQIYKKGLLYEDKRNTQIIGYCDADWADYLIDRRSNI